MDRLGKLMALEYKALLFSFGSLVLKVDESSLRPGELKLRLDGIIILELTIEDTLEMLFREGRF